MIDKLTQRLIASAAMFAALVAGFALGTASAPHPDQRPIVVTVEHEPTAAERKAQADAEIEAYNRGLEAGKFIATNPADIELKTR